MQDHNEHEEAGGAVPLWCVFLTVNQRAAAHAARAASAASRAALHAGRAERAAWRCSTNHDGDLEEPGCVHVD